jgi:hypothetical protein
MDWNWVWILNLELEPEPDFFFKELDLEPNSQYHLRVEPEHFYFVFQNWFTPVFDVSLVNMLVDNR